MNTVRLREVSPEAALWYALGEWPVEIHNGLTDGSREQLTLGLIESLKERGFVLVRTEQASDV